MSQSSRTQPAVDAGTRARTRSGPPNEIARTGAAIAVILCLVACESAVLSEPGSAQTPPPAGDWNRVLADTSIVGDVVVPAGQQWLIGRNVSVRGNVRVEGVAAMRPGSSLRFDGASPDQYVGGGMTFSEQVASDWGVWVYGAGRLDVQCTRKVGWNRTGTDPTWEPDDEYWITPTSEGDFMPRRWSPGDPLPRVSPMVPAAEVINVSRDCTITGPGHILINSSAPQRIEYVRLERMGVARQGFEQGGRTSGRYALHFHFSGDGSRGSVVRGVAAVNSEGRVYVPHASNGVTFEDVVSVNSYGEAFWWDNGALQHFSDDIHVERLLATGVEMPRAVSGATSMVSAVHLEQGRGNIMRNSVVAGVAGSYDSHGFHWIPGVEHGGRSAPWVFEEVVAHNVQGAGVRWWVNTHDPHDIDGLVTYRNGDKGLITGAYNNPVRHRDVLLFEDGLSQTSSAARSQPGGLPAGYENLTIVARSGPAITTGPMRLPPEAHVEFVDCRLTPAPGEPKVRIEEAENPVKLLFRNCGMKPSDVEFAEGLPESMIGSNIRIESEDGLVWEILLDANLNRVVRELD